MIAKKIFRRRKKCWNSNKTKYNSEEEARVLGGYVDSLLDIRPYKVYKCPYCKGYHITHSEGNITKGRMI